MKKLLTSILVLILAMSLVACGGKSEEKPATQEQGSNQETTGEVLEDVEIVASVAASVQDAILELQETYEKENPHVKLLFNFGASGGLMQQIEEGADVDLFISAGKKQVDQLQEKGLLVDETRVDLLRNDLVLIVNENHVDEVKSLNDLLNLEGTSIAMGEPESVPAGRYTLEALENLNLYEDLEPKIVFTKDVRQALNYVDTENTIAGFCYGSDALMAENSVVAEIVPADSHAPIVYPAAIIKDSKNFEETDKFFKFLQSDDSKVVFEKYGFKIAE